MRVFWITHDVFEVFFPYVKGQPTKGGSWVAPLFYNILQQPGITLASVTPVINGNEQKQEIDGVVYYSIRISKNENASVMSANLANRYLSVINDFQPDIIHIHGTEKNFALLRKYVDTKIPIVCSIQGIVSSCLDYLKYSVANAELKKHRSVKNRVGRGGVNSTLRKWRKYSDIEKEVYRINRYFIGRTAWDKAQLAAMNAGASYFHGEELLRPAFYQHVWKIDECERHRIFVPSAEYPLKGFHTLLQAAAILKRQFPEVKIVAPLSSFTLKSSKIKDVFIGEDYSNYLKSEIRKLKLTENIILRKRLSADEMAAEYSKAHLFVLPSFLENSPNSLGESMMTGTPCVASSVGGVTSIVKDNESSLLFSPGDYVFLAYQIARIFSDDELALKISANAREIALRRHNITQTSRQYYQIYSEIIKQHHESSTDSSRA
jgi:glycosyltransferase involved in cell wall biosynthesis